jgi:ABC-2 type transport system permease protein
MSITTAPTDDTTTKHQRRPTLGPVTTAELIKTRSLRSHVGLVVGTVLFLLALGPIQALGQVLAEPPLEPADSAGAAIGTALSGGSTAALIAGILGVLSVTSEYSTGLIRTTLWTVPRRRLTILGKSAALVLVLGPATLVSAAVAIEGSRQILVRIHAPLSWAEPAPWWATVAMTLYVLGWALLGQCLGWLLRSPVGASFGLLGLMFVLPLVGALLPDPLSRAISPFLVSEAGAAMMRVGGNGPGLDSTTATVVWVAWVAVGLVSATVALQRRDA